jgi:ABC-type multidrug transport system ATPase subunit
MRARCCGFKRRGHLCLNAITHLQDAATLFTITRWLRVMAHKLKQTALISLLQPPPETFALFDDVMIMNEGIIVYHGPVDEAVPFMARIGFQLPPRKVCCTTSGSSALQAVIQLG